jgi:uncharacterized membrane protein YcjF (UPF0283 family)
MKRSLKVKLFRLSIAHVALTGSTKIPTEGVETDG